MPAETSQPFGQIAITHHRSSALLIFEPRIACQEGVELGLDSLGQQLETPLAEQAG